jgi:hypothetical protein
MLAFASFSTLVARMGWRVVSQALLSLMHLSFMQVVGISIAVGTWLSFSIRRVELGFDDLANLENDRLNPGLRILFIVAPEPCLRIFTSDVDVLALGTPLLMVGAMFQVADAVGVLSGGALRGAGDTRWPFFVQTALAWGLFLPAAYVGSVVLAGGLTGAWLGGVVYVAVLGVAMRWRFRSGAWKRVRI